MSVLEGYRVLDLSIAMSGPFAAARLGDLGADVIKVEPTTGEWQRHVSAGGAVGNRINVSFLSLNRNKRSIAVNLKDPEGREAVLELAKNADVFLQNYRPGVAERLGVDYESIRAVNPEIVYVSISGYGETGPYAHRPGQDLLLQGMSGFMKSAGRAGDPSHPAPLYVVDAVTASTAFEAVLAGLLHKERTGEGQLITVNMLDAIIAFQLQEMSIFTKGGVEAARTDEPHAHVYIRAPYGAFETADREIVLAFPELPLLGRLLDIPELLDMDSERDGHERRDEVFRLVAARLKERGAQEWLDLFDSHGVWAGPVYGYPDVPGDPQVRHNGSLLTYEHPTEGTVTTPGFPIKFSRTPSALRHPTPLVGQHSREVLREAGLSHEKIDAMLASGSISTEQ
ncbi:CaiB/BaiF CoA transferase family protein [Microtetraspora malaysiensis]|uniref:CaiB/BaiF CoA transferase family protein n=1 Tax=Microtetraspora malaysiensis TaxID=161358 RepID=UPI000830306F|nr:CoA transferase [Microtetraspora malaysiensis]